MNILIKLMSIVSLVIAPTLAKVHHDKIVSNRQHKMENLILLNDNQIKNEKRDTATVSNTVFEAMNQADVKALLTGLKSDGIITTQDYTVEVRGGRLFVNGVEQTDAINNKYKQYFEGKADIIIKEHKVK